MLTPFNTLSIDGIKVIRDRNMVKNRGKLASFKTMGKSGRENASSQDMVNKVSKANSSLFKTPGDRGIKSSFQDP